jgi:hypothetical protein
MIIEVEGTIESLCAIQTTDYEKVGAEDCPPITFVRRLY